MKKKNQAGTKPRRSGWVREKKHPDTCQCRNCRRRRRKQAG